MDIVTREYHIYGLVQGVGFRPFVCDWANEHGLAGYVRNDGGIVTAVLSGPAATIEEFCEVMRSLDGRSTVLPGAMVERIEVVDDDQLTDSQSNGFRIVESTEGADELRMLPPDIATCPECLAELFDPANRRYRHPFISCTACGPRYTIMSDVPYDRVRTTMESFPMCPECEEEYSGRSRMTGRQSKNASTAARQTCGYVSGISSPAAPVRHFAQTICCNDCGPKLLAYDGESEWTGEDSFSRAVEVLRDGGIVAVKDVGGYHFCYDASNMDTDRRLREWKNRERKPFAIMFRDLDEIKKYAYVSKTEEELLTSPVAPIVLLNTDLHSKNASTDHTDARIGAFLPSNPLQHMLLGEISPLVMTSGNRGGEPIITDDDEMRALMSTGVPDLMLYHDRQILYGLDDSIYQVTSIPTELPSESCVHVATRFSELRWTHDHEGADEIIQVIRRARGLVPAPIWIGRQLPRDTFAAGGDLKSVFALGRKNAVYMSGHFGDLDDARCQKARSESIGHMETLLGIHPEASVCDKHPLYNSAVDTPNKVQHHYAHILSVAAEHDLKGKVLGVAFDGTGYGDDGTIWGGEFLLCDMDSMTYERVGHLKSVPLLGGDDSARDAKKTAFCYLPETYDAGYEKGEAALIAQALKNRINTVDNSSMGRFFDAAAAILDICYENSYEGECPIALQYAAESCNEEPPKLDFPIVEEDGMFIADSTALLTELHNKKCEGIKAEALAYAFHEAVADMTAKMCEKIISRAKDGGIDSIAISGGTMQNSLLLKLLLPKIRKTGINVYLNHLVPPGDGGISLGQIYSQSHEIG
ncbi:MAG: carbamoyltransferase HypF [Lachnospiraceae bacterium]|nr:carbamoyltransferase HypF [Lachnospiraceae bacterium]